MTEQLIDDFGRRVRYVRISVTDRCDFRCVYCMSEEMTFLPRAQVLTLEELAMVARRGRLSSLLATCASTCLLGRARSRQCLNAVVWPPRLAS